MRSGRGGFTWWGAWTSGYLPSVAAVPAEAIGRTAVRMLLERLKEADSCCPPQAVPYGLGPGQTIGPAPAAG